MVKPGATGSIQTRIEPRVRSLRAVTQSAPNAIEIERAAEVIRQADVLIVAAGAGMGVDSGLLDFVDAKVSGALILRSLLGTSRSSTSPNPRRSQATRDSPGASTAIACNSIAGRFPMQDSPRYYVGRRISGTGTSCASARARHGVRDLSVLSES